MLLENLIAASSLWAFCQSLAPYSLSTQWTKQHTTAAVFRNRLAWGAKQKTMGSKKTETWLLRESSVNVECLRSMQSPAAALPTGHLNNRLLMSHSKPVGITGITSPHYMYSTMNLNEVKFVAGPRSFPPSAANKKKNKTPLVDNVIGEKYAQTDAIAVS